MRWKRSEPMKAGEIRSYLKFAWTFTEIDGHTVWFEFYRVHQRWYDHRPDGNDDYGWQTTHLEMLPE